MTKGIDNAFPLGTEEMTASELGLTKREYFAAMAMQGMLASSTIFRILRKVNPNESAQILSLAAVEQADSLIEELNKEKL